MIIFCKLSRAMTSKSRWWQLKYYWNFHSESLGKMFTPFWRCHIFPSGLVWFNHQLDMCKKVGETPEKNVKVGQPKAPNPEWCNERSSGPVGIGGFVGEVKRFTRKMVAFCWDENAPNLHKSTITSWWFHFFYFSPLPGEMIESD